MVKLRNKEFNKGHDSTDGDDVGRQFFDPPPGPPLGYKQERHMILPCNCKHAYQDKRYGIGKRVHNPTKDESKFKCTVCGKEKTK